MMAAVKRTSQSMIRRLRATAIISRRKEKEKKHLVFYLKKILRVITIQTCVPLDKRRLLKDDQLELVKTSFIIPNLYF